MIRSIAVMKNFNSAFWGLTSVTVLFCTIFIMLIIGNAAISPMDMLTTLINSTVGIKLTEGLNPAFSTIIWEIRWPRIALAILAGSSLAVSGACYQAIFKNPLGDPFILGVSSGAALGAAFAIVLGQSALISLFAFIGGVATIFAVYSLGVGNGRIAVIDSNRLLLAGVACGSLLNALLSAVMAVNTRQVTEILFWLMGNLSNPPESLWGLVITIAIGLTVIFAHARDLDIMTTGDETAQFLGVNVVRVRIVLLLATALITSSVVAMTGTIGFVGMIVPHIIRKFCGASHVKLLPLSAVWGAVFLLWADGVTRVIPALAQIPVGVVTAMFGSPFFLYLLSARGKK